MPTQLRNAANVWAAAASEVARVTSPGSRPREALAFDGSPCSSAASEALSHRKPDAIERAITLESRWDGMVDCVGRAHGAFARLKRDSAGQRRWDKSHQR